MSENYTSREERRRSQGDNKQKNKSSSSTPKKKRGGIFRKIVVVVLLLGFVSMIAGAGTFFALVSDAPKIDDSMLKDSLSSKIYDVNEEKFAELGGQKRTYVQYDDIPPFVKEAFLATEDVRFFKHHGIDFYRIGGAVVANFKEGFGSEGASTITQQVVKNSFLTPEKTIKRKVQEMWLSFQLERKYSKQQILEMYLNKIYFAKGEVYGIAKAAETFYGVTDLNDLELHQAAMLAGLPKAPNTYNPYNNPESATKRRNIVLTLMERHGFITKAEADAAKKVDVQETLVERTEEQEQYAAFIDEVIEEVKTKTEADVFSAGLEIYTTLDPEAQSYVEKTLNTNEVVQFPNENFQAAVVLLDTETGAVRAIGGGRNRVSRGFSLATDNYPQPGSTIKPILDFGPAIEHLNWSTAQPINDEPYTYSNGTAINNFDRSHKGWLSAREALGRSRNIPALKAFQAVGAEKAREFGAGLGIPLEKAIPEAYSIGGFNKGVSPLQLAGAYSAFGNNGIYNKPHTVTKVKFPDGTEMDLTPKPKVAMKDSTAFMVTHMLKSVVEEPYGTARAVRTSGLEIAGKTGTTNFDADDKARYNIRSGGVKDVWFAGYTPKYTAAVWTGYEKYSSENYIYSQSEKDMAKSIFKKVVSHVSQGKDRGSFKQPNSVVKVPIEKVSGEELRKPSAGTPSNMVEEEYFIRGTEPTKVSKKFMEADRPKGVKAQFDPSANQINVSWSYPEDKMNDVTFQVNTSVDGSSSQQSTKNTSIVVPSPTPGATYTFTITATFGGSTSKGASASVRIPGGEEEEPSEDENDSEEQRKEDDDEEKDKDDSSDQKENKDDKGKDKDKEKEKDKEKDKDKEQQPPPNEGNQPSPPPSNDQGGQIPPQSPGDSNGTNPPTSEG
ncbi:PBP1A family penicillin-binding protein [Bacillus sp. CGMCC 1.16541]|uniref:PBP1A family penicillin-binding protein n=1 Tax=Bacillus sp. CGMCC 1.16541 TaxID=2185143 RepID=UPI000D730813|nr:PBP1A family penicillin-binding protein [Bacillus sp. CGMCC 1.16541]